MPPENDDSTETSTDTQSETPKPEDQFGNLANAAAKSHITRFSEKILPGLLAAAMKPLHDEIASLRAPKPEEDKTKSKGTDPQVAALQASLEEFKSKLTSEQQARIAAEQKSRDDRAHNALKSELAPHVRPELLGMLADNLYHMKKVVDFDDDGSPLFKSKKLDAFGDPEEVRMPLKDGVQHFLKSEEAKAFLPAPSSGSGASQMRKPGSKATAPFNPETASEADKIRHSMEQVQRALAKGLT